MPLPSALIICADDAGFAEESDRAILRCHSEGVVRAASVSVTQPRARRFVEEALSRGLEVGLHLDLTEGPPLTGVIEQLAPDGRSFLRNKPATWNLLQDDRNAKLNEAIARELLAQWERLLSFDATPSHLNGHNHMHVLPAVRPALRQLLATHAVPHVRVPLDYRAPHEHPSVFDDLVAICTTLQSDLQQAGVNTAAFAGYCFTDDPSRAALLGCVGENGPLEIMVHPGTRPGSPFTESEKRNEETRVLADPTLAEALRARGYVPTGFLELQAVRGGGHA